MPGEDIAVGQLKHVVRRAYYAFALFILEPLILQYTFTLYRRSKLIFMKINLACARIVQMLFRISCILFFTLLFSYCKKDDDILKPFALPPGYVPPVANAGKDKSILLPDNRFLSLSGGGTGTGNHALIKSWKQLSGPAPLSMKSDDFGSLLLNLDLEGAYVFELTVTDIWKTSGKDTITVTATWNNACSQNRKVVSAQYSLLSQSPFNIPADESIISSGQKILFAGGHVFSVSDDEYFRSKDLFIYDVSSGKWDKRTLPFGYNRVSLAAEGGLVFLSGKKEETSSITMVTIYDLAGNTYSEAKLSVARVGMATAIIGNKVFFAGGIRGDSYQASSDAVDIYDISSKTWTTSKLSEARSGISATVAGNKVIFAGGMTGPCSDTSCSASKAIDIYDQATGQWTVSQLMYARGMLSATANGNEILFAGGTSERQGIFQPGIVESWNLTSQLSTFDCLSSMGSGNAIMMNDQDFYMPSSGSINKYDTRQKAWTLGLTPFTSKYIHSYNNNLYALVYKQTSDLPSGQYEVYKINF